MIAINSELMNKKWTRTQPEIYGNC